MRAPSKHWVGAAAPPQPIEVEGEIGPVARLADGRIASIYGVGRPVDKWDDASIPQQVFGRFSSERRAAPATILRAWGSARQGWR